VTDFPNFPTCHSHPQSFDSGSTPEAMVAREKDLGTGAVTMTDHGTLQAARIVYKAARKAKLRPILGLEGYFRDDDCSTLAAHGITKGEDGTVKHFQKYQHITMHALDQEGYEAIVRVLSKVDERAEQHGHERKPLFAWSHLEELGSHNITFCSSCLVGMVMRHLLVNRPDLAEAYYVRLRGCVKPGNFYVEVFPHVCTHNWVRGTFLELGTLGRRKYHNGKWLRIRYDGATEDLPAKELAAKFDRWLSNTKKAMPKVELVAVKHYQTWEDEPEPLVILGAHEVADFIRNECTPYAPDGDVQLGANQFIIGLAKKYGDPILISDDSHFASPDDKVVQDVRLLNLDKGKDTWRFFGSYHRKTSAEAFAYFNQYLGIDEGEFRSWVENSLAWSQRFGWEFKDRKELPTKFYPADSLGHVKDLIAKVGRMDWSNKAYRDRLAAEIRMLYQNGTIDLLPYFAMAHEVVDFYEQQGKLAGPGRGSAAGMLLAYLLGITHVDPLKYNLSMERFLTASRVRSGKLPDIDMDFGDRAPLLDPKDGWLWKRFGDHVAQISTDTMLRLKSSIQDVHRVMDGSVRPEVFELTKKMEEPPQGISDKKFIFGYEDPVTGAHVAGSIESDAALQTYTKTYPKHWEVVQKCLGLVKGKGRHASAYVITNEPVSNFIPTTTISDVRNTQYNMHGVEEAGGIKMDFLGVNSLNDIEKAIKLVQRKHGYTPKDEVIKGRRVPGLRVVPEPRGDGTFALYDVWDLPEDQEVFRQMCAGQTETVFQFNTGAARQWLKEFNVGGKHSLKSLEDLSSFTALDRPGPLDATVEEEGTKRNMLQEFAARARGEKPIGANPVLDKLLPETYGVIVFQEQLQKVFVQVGRTTPEQGDDFRVHISKKKMEDVLKDRAIFMPGAVETVGEQEAERIWNMLETFGQYGFNLSHSTCYALIGAVCAWFKAHHPLEWWTAVLSNADREEIDSKFWGHCGHLVDMPDVKLSGDSFEIQNGRIRAPLSLLKGIGPAAHLELSEHRPFADLREFVQRIYDRKVRTGTEVVEEKVVKRGPDKGKTVQVKKVKLGRSNLGPALVTRLIVSGAADSLFPTEAASVYDKLALFSQVWGEVHAKKPEPVDPRFIHLTPLQRYMLKKSILPSYSQDLMPFVASARDDVQGGKGRYAWRMPREFVGNKLCPLLSGRLLRAALDGDIPLTPKFKLAAIGYVTETEWFWNNRAVKIRVEVNGERFEFIRWPDRADNPDGTQRQVPVKLPPDLVGSVVIFSLVRFRIEKEFKLDDLVIVEPPFATKASEESSPVVAAA
jgi:DNA-directed DNA polymerase III PolC